MQNKTLAQRLYQQQQEKAAAAQQQQEIQEQQSIAAEQKKQQENIQNASQQLVSNPEISNSNNVSILVNSLDESQKNIGKYDSNNQRNFQKDVFADNSFQISDNFNKYPFNNTNQIQVTNSQIQDQNKQLIQNDNINLIENNNQSHKNEINNYNNERQIVLEKIKDLKQKKPKILDENEINIEIRKELNYDINNLFTYQERDINGMKKILNLRNEVDVENELDYRKQQCIEKRGILEFVYKNSLRKYQEQLNIYRSKYPDLVDSSDDENTIYKKKKQNIQAIDKKQILQKKQKRDENDMANNNSNNCQDKEEGSFSEDDGSNYSESRFRKGGKKPNKRLQKLQNHEGKQNLYYESDEYDRNAQDNHFYHRKHSNIDHRNVTDHKGKSYKFIEDNYHLIKDYEDFKSNEDFSSLQVKIFNKANLIFTRTAQQTEKYSKLINEILYLKQKVARYDDLKQIWLPRSKIEQWVDEPFFKNTIIGTIVRVVGLNQKYFIALVKSIREDLNQQYKMNNGYNTAIQLELLTSDDQSEKVKLYKTIQISNQPFTREEYEKFQQSRKNLKMQYIDCETIQKKINHIKKARNYVYQNGELEAIAEKKFERALIKGDLNGFPNVTYFHKKKLIEKDLLTETLQENQRYIEVEKLKETLNKEEIKIFKFNQHQQLTAEEHEKISNQLNKVNRDIITIEKHLQKDLRITKFINSEGGEQKATIKTIEEQEDLKKYHEWLESQKKDSEIQKVKSLIQKQQMMLQKETEKEIVEQNEQEMLDQKEQLFLEIQTIIKLNQMSKNFQDQLLDLPIQEKSPLLNKQLSVVSQVSGHQPIKKSGNQMSYFERVERQKYSILQAHQSIHEKVLISFNK